MICASVRRPLDGLDPACYQPSLMIAPSRRHPLSGILDDPGIRPDFLSDQWGKGRTTVVGKG